MVAARLAARECALTVYKPWPLLHAADLWRHIPRHSTMHFRSVTSAASWPCSFLIICMVTMMAKITAALELQPLGSPSILLIEPTSPREPKSHGPDRAFAYEISTRENRYPASQWCSTTFIYTRL